MSIFPVLALQATLLTAVFVHCQLSGGNTTRIAPVRLATSHAARKHSLRIAAPATVLTVRLISNDTMPGPIGLANIVEWTAISPGNSNYGGGNSIRAITLCVGVLPIYTG